MLFYTEFYRFTIASFYGPSEKFVKAVKRLRTKRFHAEQKGTKNILTWGHFLWSRMCFLIVCELFDCSRLQSTGRQTSERANVQLLRENPYVTFQRSTGSIVRSTCPERCWARVWGSNFFPHWPTWTGGRRKKIGIYRIWCEQSSTVDKSGRLGWFVVGSGNGRTFTHSIPFVARTDTDVPAA